MASGTNPRVYNIATETANGRVNSAMLTDEVIVAGLSVALAYINTENGTLEIFFAAPLTGSDIIALDAVVLAHQGVIVSAIFRMWKNDAVQSTALETYQSALLRTPVTALAPGAYRVQWYWETRIVVTGPLNSRCQTRMVYNGTVVGQCSCGTEGWMSMSGWDRIVGVAEGLLPTFEVEFRRDPVVGGNDTCEIRRVRMSFEKMG